MVCILIIDDNDLNRDMLGRRFERRGFEVVDAADGETGLDLAWQIEPDLILMDMSMPGLDGWETSSRLKADPRTMAIPIIGLSAFIHSEDRDRALAVGCADYDTKPVDFPRLLAKVSAILGKDHGESPSEIDAATPHRRIQT